LKRIAAAVSLCLLSIPAHAAGTLIPVNQPADMAHDYARGIIYISSPSQVLRFQVSTGSFLSPIDIPGSLAGIDISPDSRYLAVADKDPNGAGICIHIVDLDLLTQRLSCAPLIDSMEDGTASVAYGDDGSLYTLASEFNAYEAPIRRLDPVTEQWSLVARGVPSARLSASGDAQTIGFVGKSTSSGDQWGFVDVQTGAVVRRDFPQSRFAAQIAVDRFGAQFSVLGDGAAYFFDDVYAATGSISEMYMQCISYHPVERLVYSCPYESAIIPVRDSNTLADKPSIDIGEGGMEDIRLSRDGSLIMARLPDGIRYYQQYSPLAAAPVSVTTGMSTSTPVTLLGSVGNGASIAYSLTSLPLHGSVNLSGNVATYVPAAGYIGGDSFGYRVQYGRVVRANTVTVTVVDPNRPPVAVNDSAYTRNTAIQIAVLANDSDPDGDPISLASVTTPTAGTSAIQGSKVLFTPPKKWPNAPVTFNYSIRDPKGKLATALVTVTRN
jgi:hypothetical protein